MFYENVWFWVALIVSVVLGVYKMVPFGSKLISTLGGPKKSLAIFVIAALFVGGVLDQYIGAVGVKGASVGGGTINLIDITEDVSGNCTTAVDAQRENTITVRCTDVGVDEGAGVYELLANFSLTRSGSDYGSCDITITSNTFKSPSDLSDTNDYWILERTNLGQLEAYIAIEAYTATTSNTKGHSVLGFDIGETTNYFAIALEVDEEGSDELNQYDKVNINLNICGVPYLIEYMEMDAP